MSRALIFFLYLLFVLPSWWMLWFLFLMSRRPPGSTFCPCGGRGGGGGGGSGGGGGGGGGGGVGVVVGVEVVVR